MRRLLDWVKPKPLPAALPPPAPLSAPPPGLLFDNAPRSGPDAASKQMSGGRGSNTMHGAELVHNTGLQGGRREYYRGEVPKAQRALIRTRRAVTQRSVPPNSDTLGGSRWGRVD